MGDQKPRIFLGSSVEGLKIAYVIQENLEHDAICTVWPQGIFELSGNTLENLIAALAKFDYAIFIFNPDDTIRMREKEYRVVRDNVIFELGLFIGKLGKERVFFLVPKHDEGLHIPTDLAGINPGTFESCIDDDLPSVLGPFCNKVRRQISSPIKKVNSEKEPEIPTDVDKREYVEFGVYKDAFGNFEINVDPSEFFEYRLSKAFPGVRNLVIFDDASTCINRIMLLLKQPLTFELSSENGTIKPIWWFRAGSSMPIESVSKLDGDKILLDYDELKIKKIGVYHSSVYWQSFMYVEVTEEEQTGIYKIPKDEIDKKKEKGEIFREEYAVYEKSVITREEYDDGAAVISGEVIDTSGATLRVRYLTPYNFIISGISSSINSHEFDRESKRILAEILLNKSTINDLVDLIKSIPRYSSLWSFRIN